MTRTLEERALCHGIQPSHAGADGRPVAVPRSTLEYFLAILGDSAGPADALDSLADVGGSPCHLPDWLRSTRAWGIALQLYELRSRRDWGIGDFADLAAFCGVAAAAGADFVGLNPLHALFMAEPQRCSPFSPSNRLFLNPLYIAVDKVQGYEPDMVDLGELGELRSSELVDYPRVARLKLGILRRIWQAGKANQDADFAAFRAAAGTALERHALFEALSLHLGATGHGCGWKTWPAQYRNCNDPVVARFAGEHSDETDFHAWLQWLARRQLDEAADAAREAGMRIGLYLDFAVGEAPDGSATWSAPELVVSGVHIGAPPDVFSAGGQDWGLAPLSPRALAFDGFASYRRMMQAAMMSAGALRLDHAMSLRQLFWIPEGRPASEGGFVSYPMDRLISELGTLSRANETIVIGEDLGHVPPGFRARMEADRILSYRILYFEQRGEGFLPPRRWPSLALACLSTHDLPTLEGWWAGDDIALRREHGLIAPAEALRQNHRRNAERRALLKAMDAGAMMSRRIGKMPVRARGGPGPDLVVAAHRFVARTPCRLASLRLADAVGERHPTNLPGVAEGYPNWRRRLSVALEDLEATPLFAAVTSAFRRERPR